MEHSLSYIISEVSFCLGRFKLIFNDCSILRESICEVHESLQCSYFSEYNEAVEFIRTTLKKNGSPFRFSLLSAYSDTPVDAGEKYVLLKVLVRVS